jgi:hypothetical protein
LRLAPNAIREHFFIFAVGSYGRCVSEYALRLLSESVPADDAVSRRRPLGTPPRFWQRSAGGTSLWKAMQSGVASWVDKETLCTVSHVRESARILLAFVLAFYIGRVGIRGVMSDYSSTPAGVTVFLLAFDHRGNSTFIKKFARFQGVCVGTLLGQIIFATLFRCSPGGAVAGFIVVCVFEFFAFYFYFTSEHFWYTGLLIATFGAQQMLSSCSGVDDSPWQVYQALLDQVVAILCVIFSDLLLAPPSPSRLAVKALAEASELIDRAASELLFPGETSAISTSREPIMAKLIAATELGTEAALEPRFARTPWREELWNVLVHRSFKLAKKLVLMEYIAAKHVNIERNDQDEPVDEVSDVRRSAIVRLLRCPAVQRAAKEFQIFRDQIMALGQELMLHEVEAPLVPEHTCDMQWLVLHQNTILNIANIAQQLDYPSIDEESDVIDSTSPFFLSEETTNPSMPQNQGPAELEEDAVAVVANSGADNCEVGAFLLMLELSTHDLVAITESIVQVPEVSVSAIVCAAAAPKKAGLLRTLSGKLDVAIKKSKESVQDLWSKLNPSDDNFKDAPPPLPRAQSQPSMRVTPSSPTARKYTRNTSCANLG